MAAPGAPDPITSSSRASEPKRERRSPIQDLLAKAGGRIWATLLIVAMNVAGFVVETWLGASPTSPTVPELRAAGADFGVSVVEGDWWRPFTAMFLHSGIDHLTSNMLGLLAIGWVIEWAFGKAPFLFLYLASGLAASLVSLWVHPMAVSTGASGALFGVFGATAAFLVVHRANHAVSFPLWSRLLVLAFLANDVYGGLTTPDRSVDVAGHAAGFVTGVLAGVALTRDLSQRSQRVVWRLVAFGLTVALFAGGVGVERRLRTDPEVRRFRALQAAVDCGRGSRDASSGAARELAIETCTKAIDLDPTSVDLLAQRASLYDDEKKADLAVADADAALALDRTNELALRVRLHAHLVQMKADAAHADCTALLGIVREPGVIILSACTRMARSQGDRAAERARVDQWLAIAPADPVAHFFRAQLNEREGQFVDSRKDFEAVVAVAGNDPTNWNCLAWVEVLVGDFSAARAHADKAVSGAPDAGAFRGTRCFALAGLGDSEDAHVDCTKAAELLPDSLIFRGMLAYLDRRYDDARQAWGGAGADPSVAREVAPWLAKLPGR
jgi:membrane associated rhomboid family serine protease/Flp pilus assembly protein TadD